MPRGQQLNSETFRLDEAREVVVLIDDVAPVLPNLVKPALEAVASTRVLGLSDLLPRVRRNCQLPMRPITDEENVAKRLNVLSDTIVGVIGWRRVLVDLLAVIEDEIDDAGIEEDTPGQILEPQHRRREEDVERARRIDSMSAAS